VPQVTIYRHPQLAPLVQQYQLNVNYAVMLRHVPLAIAGITWHLLAHALLVRISQTAILAAKLQTRALPAIVAITWHLLAHALLVRISQTAILAAKLLTHA
jgi:hypothetical protein